MASRPVRRWLVLGMTGQVDGCGHTITDVEEMADAFLAAAVVGRVTAASGPVTVAAVMAGRVRNRIVPRGLGG